jgi:hypothetical protein
MYMCLQVHVGTHTFVGLLPSHVSLDIYMHTYIYICTYIYTRTFVGLLHVFVHIFTHAPLWDCCKVSGYIHTHDIHILTYIKHTYICTCTCRYTHLCGYTHIHSFVRLLRTLSLRMLWSCCELSACASGESLREARNRRMS